MPSSPKDFLGLYAGLVVDVADPLQLGRIKARVPVLHGTSADGGIISDSDLPWCLPSGLPCGNATESGGVSWIPTIGDQVWIRFLDGEPEKPVWEWGNQNIPGAESWGKLPLHQYADDGLPLRRAALSRFEHWMELIPTGLDLWTKSGYHFQVVDETEPGTPSGRLEWTTALGFSLMLNDATEELSSFSSNTNFVTGQHRVSAHESADITTPVLGLNVGSIEIGGDYSSLKLDAVSRTDRGFEANFNHIGLSATQSIWLSCASIFITDSGLSFDADNMASGPTHDVGFGVNGGTVTLGKLADNPVVRLQDLVDALRSVKTYVDSHVHTGVDPGIGLSGPPSVKAKFTASGSQKVVVEPTTTVTENVQ